jgi:toxin-antitoxin system PIN domain toxin
MRLPDANILLYAYNKDAEHHNESRHWLDQSFAEPDPIALPWLVTQAFIRVGTNPRIFSSPLTVEQATRIVSSWLKRSNVEVIEPSPRYWGIFGGLLLETGTAGLKVTDAALAALAIDHGAVLCSTDRDFRRFPGLKLLDPLDPVRYRVQDAFKAGLDERGAYR